MGLTDLDLKGDEERRARGSAGAAKERRKADATNLADLESSSLNSLGSSSGIDGVVEVGLHHRKRKKKESGRASRRVGSRKKNSPRQPQRRFALGKEDTSQVSDSLNQ